MQILQRQWSRWRQNESVSQMQRKRVKFFKYRFVNRRVQTGMGMVMSMRSQCHACGGQGKTAANKCGTCHGHGQVTESKSLV